MPPKPKFTRNQIVQTALEIVAENGADALTAKSLGHALGTSTSPIFTVFDTMQEVQEAVKTLAMECFEHFDEDVPFDGPLFKRIGMKMVRFGVQQPKLYQLLFMQENDTAHGFEDIFGQLGHTAEMCVETLKQDYALTEAVARKLFENMWIYTFGVGALCATRVCRFEDAELGKMLSTQFQALMLMIKSEMGKNKSIDQ